MRTKVVVLLGASAIAAFAASATVKVEPASAVTAREICRSACRASYDYCRAQVLGLPFNRGACKRQRNTCWARCEHLPG